MITGTNHLTFTVADLQVSIAFYQGLLGMTLNVYWDKGAYLSVGDTWLCLSLGDPRPANDYTHVAFSIREDTLPEMHQRLEAAGVTQWQQNSSEGDSLYILDPDGHRLELHCGSLATRLASLKASPYSGLVWC